MPYQHVLIEHQLRPKKLTIPQYYAALTQRREEEKKFLAQLQDLSFWVYPVLRASTEQMSEVSLMSRLPWSSGSHVCWTAPTVYEVGASLFDTKKRIVDRFIKSVSARGIVIY